MNLKSKIRLILLLAIGLIIGVNLKAYASSVSVSAPSSVAPGATFSVTVTGNDAIGRFSVAVSGGSSGTSSIWLEPSATFSVTAGSSGNVSISVNSVDASSSVGTAVTASGSASVAIQSSNSGNSGGINNSGSTSNGNNGGTASNGNTTNTNQTGAKITSLGITPLEYDFSNYKVGAPSGTTYYATVPNEVTSISIYANGATSGTGTKTLKEGTNKFTVSNGTYTYYINVTRATLDGEDVANKPDDEERDEDTDTVIGLKTLSIEGYELDKEFKSDVFEYKVKVEEPLTQIQLDQIKELIKVEVNAENVEYEVVTELSEDGIATITIIVKDDEKEYSKYTITFEVEEETEEVIGAVLPMPNKANPTRGMFGLTEEQQIYAILGAFGATFLIALTYAVISYVQHRKLVEYTEDDEDNFEDYYGEDEEEPSVIEQLYKDRNSDSMAAELQEEDIPKSLRNYSSAKIEEPVENVEKIDTTISDANEISDKDESDSVIDKAIGYERKLFNARSLKSGRRAGKH